MVDLVQDFTDALGCANGNLQAKVLITESRGQGRRMLQWLARQGCALLNVTVETPYSLALALCRAQGVCSVSAIAAAKDGVFGDPVQMQTQSKLQLNEQPTTSLQGGEAVIISDVVAQGVVLMLLQQQTKGFYSQPSAQTQKVAEKLSDAFLELAMAQVSSLTASVAGMQNAVPSARLADTEALRQAYQNKKKELGYLDRSDVFVQAIALLNQQTNGQEVAGQQANVKQGAKRRAAKKQDASGAASNQPKCKYIALSSMAVTPLEKTFLAALTGGKITPIPMPQGDVLDALSGKPCRFLACRGVETEVRAVLRDILLHKRNLADCAVVYLGGEYPQQLYKMAPRFEIPLALEGGIPLRESALFAALQGLHAWAAAQYSIELLYPLLVNRDCTPKYAPQLANFLAKRPASWGKESYILADTQRPEGIVAETWADWQAFLTCVTAIGEPFVATHKNNLQTLLAHYMPLHRMGEGAAYHATLTLLESAAQTCAEGEPLLARLLTSMKGGSYQPSTTAEPSLLCLPVAKALLSGRKTLYVMGLTRYALEDGGTQSPILLDVEREALSPRLDTVANRAARLAAQFNRLVATHQGELIFSYPNFESVHMAPVQPAPFYRYALAQTNATEEQVGYLAQTPLTAADFVVGDEQTRAKVWASVDVSQTAEQADTQEEASGGVATEQAAQAAQDNTPTTQATKTEPTEGAQVTGGNSDQTDPTQAIAEPLATCMQDFVFSASSLEAAFACPLQFYLDRVLRLKDDAPTSQRMDRWLRPSTRGTFIHWVLEQYYLAEIAHRANASNPAPNLDDIYQIALTQLEAENPCPHAAAEQAKSEELPVIRAMLEAAVVWTKQAGRTVQQAEQHIGTHETPIELQISAEKSIWFMGSIDRVDAAIVTAATAPDDADATDSTSDTSNPEFATATPSTYILDYKSGDACTFQEKMDLHLQHYLYTLAYEQTHAGETVAAAGYLLLNTEVTYAEIAQTQTLRAEMQKKVLALLAVLADETKIQTPCPCYRLEGDALVLGDTETRKNAHENCKRYCPYSDVCAPSWEWMV